MSSRMEFQTTAQVCKVDRKLGLVFGYAMVCKVDGEAYFDLQDEHIPEDVMLEMAANFMKSGPRLSRDMHETDDGTVWFAFPMTSDIAKALDIQVKKTGLIIGMKPSKEVLEKFASGERTGFSIGGAASYREVED